MAFCIFTPKLQGPLGAIQPYSSKGLEKSLCREHIGLIVSQPGACVTTTVPHAIGSAGFWTLKAQSAVRRDSALSWAHVAIFVMRQWFVSCLGRCSVLPESGVMSASRTIHQHELLDVPKVLIESVIPCIHILECCFRLCGFDVWHWSASGGWTRDIQIPRNHPACS